MARLPWLSDASPLPSANAPMISVIFAARDEEEKLSAALVTLLAQDYPQFEVVAVNDRSLDQTPEILHEFEGANKNLKVIDIASLPPGWLGKPHALVAGSSNRAVNGSCLQMPTFILRPMCCAVLSLSPPSGSGIT